METQGRYVLIGGFALGGLFGLLAFVLWFASLEVDQQFDYYDIEFESVSGLSAASAVRFNGFEVGQVLSLDLAPDRSGRILVRIEVDAATPIRAGSVATIDSMGVTGVGFVSIASGPEAAPFLQDMETDGGVPKIQAGRSALQALSQDAPQIVEEILVVTEQVRTLLGPQNQQRVENIFANLDESSGDLSAALDSFSTAAETIASSTEDIAAFTTRLETISAAATTALETADETLQEITELAQRAEGTLAALDVTLGSGQSALAGIDAFIFDDLPLVVGDLRDTAAQVRTELAAISTDTREMLGTFSETGTAATARLAEAEATIAAANTMLAELTEAMTAVETASNSFEALVSGDGAELVAELRSTVAAADGLIATATKVAETDLPDIVSDIREATASAADAVDKLSTDLDTALDGVTADLRATITGVGETVDTALDEATTNLNTVVGDVGTDLTTAIEGMSAEVTETLESVGGLSDEAEAALTAATETFSAANATLSNLNTAIEAGVETFASADRAFATADTLMREDIAVIAGDLRGTIGALEDAIGSVSDDLPEITAALRDTANRANSAIGQIERAVKQHHRPNPGFCRRGPAAIHATGRGIPCARRHAGAAHPQHRT